MKKLLFSTFVLLLAFSNVVFAGKSDAEVVTAFKQYVGEEVNKVISTYKAGTYRVGSYRVLTTTGHGSTERIAWRKSYVTVDPQYTIDLKKSDSLISPYVGTLNILKTYRSYEEGATKEEAEKSTTVWNEGATAYEFTIAYQEEQWVVTKLTKNGHNVKIESIYDTLKSK